MPAGGWSHGPPRLPTASGRLRCPPHSSAPIKRQRRARPRTRCGNPTARDPGRTVTWARGGVRGGSRGAQHPCVGHAVRFGPGGIRAGPPWCTNTERGGEVGGGHPWQEEQQMQRPGDVNRAQYLAGGGQEGFRWSVGSEEGPGQKLSRGLRFKPRPGLVRAVWPWPRRSPPCTPMFSPVASSHTRRFGRSPIRLVFSEY